MSWPASSSLSHPVLEALHQTLLAFYSSEPDILKNILIILSSLGDLLKDPPVVQQWWRRFDGAFGRGRIPQLHRTFVSPTTAAGSRNTCGQQLQWRQPTTISQSSKRLSYRPVSPFSTVVSSKESRTDAHNFFPENKILGKFLPKPPIFFKMCCSKYWAVFSKRKENFPKDLNIHLTKSPR